ncbi:hypothetical protein [Paenibacillus silvisoli]|uniref:hypothetical protein n=1 Tax=Paenibacillus silvisoli TaxID=3110539 RepID=UPI002804AEBB|nr:hypothetical protein [Paenibacillus silvisoli]
MELRLYHYFDKQQGPFRNLSSLPGEEAEAVLQRLKQRQKGFASKRADDYMSVRRALEDKAKELFVAKGGRPRLSFPHYMTLGACDWIHDWYEDGDMISIPLTAFDEWTVSFTYGDLFPTMRFEDGKSYRKQVYTAEEIKCVIEQYGFPQSWNADGTRGPERYIEAQVWDERVILAYSGKGD